MNSIGSSLIAPFSIDFAMGVPSHRSIRTIKLSDQERRIVAELPPSDGLGNQRMQQFRASVHFDAAIKDQAELVWSLSMAPINASLLRIGFANPIRNAICRCLNSGPAIG